MLHASLSPHLFCLKLGSNPTTYRSLSLSIVSKPTIAAKWAWGLSTVALSFFFCEEWIGDRFGCFSLIAFCTSRGQEQGKNVVHEARAVTHSS